MDEPFIAMSPEITIRKTTKADLDFVMDTEHTEENKRYIIPWDSEMHQKSLVNPDILHFIIENSDNGRYLGYGIIAGLENPHKSIELQRIVIVEKGRGYGRQSLRVLKKWVFETLKAHRLWLDVKEFNYRAQHLYESEGFLIEGKLRECLKSGDGHFESLVVMSMLHGEYVP